MHDAYIHHIRFWYLRCCGCPGLRGMQIYWRPKITRKASDAAENLQLYRVVRFFHQRSSCMTTHISADVQQITLNTSCMTILGGRTKQLDIFCHVTGFTSDFLSFIVVELIWFFHRAIQILLSWWYIGHIWWRRFSSNGVSYRCTEKFHKNKSILSGKGFLLKFKGTNTSSVWGVG